MRKLFLIGLVFTLLFSCDKDDSSLTSPSLGNYFPLAIGNYWVYEHYQIDSLGNEIRRNQLDSVIISRDTLINGLQYFVLEGNYSFFNNEEHWGIIDILRDSASYLVNDKGRIRFSATNFTDALDSFVETYQGDTIFVTTYQMDDLESQVIVPAGEFETLNYKGTTLDFTLGTQSPVYNNCYYAKNVGKVLESCTALNLPILLEKRLIRYKVKTE
ncbi:hypothetical protein [Sediminitomix flava]|uniref:Uncharacterized protein n=1 Tax=Sediminitomix flava TaxID=379075 RepID=A0A315ZC95_SEDFL|nr:hypothetical protein [Sediminitomix flava]PWJ43195.1 hypothetical protein BC781_102744 [Sediminitomix flava]